MSLLLSLQQGSGGYSASPSVVYLLGPFRFATDEAAPMASPHTEAGAVGSLTITDTNNQLSTSGGALAIAGSGAPAAWANPGVAGSSITRAPGMALIGTLRQTAGTNGPALWWTNSSANLNYGSYSSGEGGFGLVGNLIYESGAASSVGASAANTDYEAALILRSTGCFVVVRGGTYTSWTLLFVRSLGSSATLYLALSNFDGVGTVDNLRATNLGGAWATDNGIATSYKATTTDADTATMTANALVYHTITAQTGVTQELRFRVTDASNYWLLRMAAPGTNTIKVIEVVAGVETERASTAQTFTNATQYRIGVIAAGAVITPYVDTTAKTGYASAATGLTATGVYVSHAGTKLECWPRTVSLPSGV